MFNFLKIFTMPFNKLDESTIGKIRPRFKLSTTLTQEEIMHTIYSEAKLDNSISKTMYGRYIKLCMPKKGEHTWSPVLHLNFEKNEDGGTLIRCLIGPKDAVWQTIMMCYIAFSILGMFGSIFAWSKWHLTGETIYLLLFPLTILVLSSIFIISKIGTQKAHLEMLHLLRFLRRAVDSTDCVRCD